MAKTKFNRVATEGATVDGRTIERKWIEQAAKNFNRAKFGARVWLEHYRGTVPGGPFDALGDVLAVEQRTVEDGKLALFAQIEPLPALIDINKKGQKLYTSIEIEPNFAETGEAYLTGLAVTDSPASLGTDILKFAATGKQSATALFSVAEPFQLEMEDAAPSNDASAVHTLLEGFRQIVGKFTAAPAPAPAAAPAAPAAPAQVTAAPHTTDFSAAMLQLGTVMQAMSQQQTAMQQQLSKLEQTQKDTVEKLSAEPAGNARPTATGNDGRVLADC